MLKLRESFSALSQENEALAVPIHALADNLQEFAPVVAASSYIAKREPDIPQPGCCLLSCRRVLSVVDWIPCAAHAVARLLPDRLFGRTLVKYQTTGESRQRLPVSHRDESIHPGIRLSEVYSSIGVAARCMSESARSGRVAPLVEN